MQVAVAGVEDVGAAQAVLASPSRRWRSACRPGACAGWSSPCTCSRGRCGRSPGTRSCARSRTCSRSASSALTARRVAPAASSTSIMRAISSLDLGRRCRRSRTAGSPRRRGRSRRGRSPRPRAVIGPSIISRPAGMMPAAMIAATASPALLHVVEAGHDAARRLRLGQQLHRDLDDHREHAFAADHEREQVEARRIERVAAELDRLALDREAAHRSTLCSVRPYLRQCTPPEFSATLPPMVQAIWLLGSGA